MLFSHELSFHVHTPARLLNTTRVSLNVPKVTGSREPTSSSNSSLIFFPPACPSTALKAKKGKGNLCKRKGKIIGIKEMKNTPQRMSYHNPLGQYQAWHWHSRCIATLLVRQEEANDRDTEWGPFVVDLPYQSLEVR